MCAMTVDATSSDQIFERCEDILGYKFKDRELLQLALTHASGANTRLASNERLEFLGDAILGVVICEQLYKQFPEYLEGDLTKIKSMVVSGETCAKISTALGIDQLLFLGKGMVGKASLPMSVAGAVFESIVAAVYLDGGIVSARDLVLTHMRSVILEVASSENHRNYKSQLQQYAQQEVNSPLAYELLDEQGPDHSKCFEICAKLAGRRFNSAWGASKKEAEQKAARNALLELDLLTQEQ